MIRRVIDFMRYNGEKWMTITVYLYVAYYRLCLLFVPMPRIEKMIGVRGAESEAEETLEKYKACKAGRVSCEQSHSAPALKAKMLCACAVSKKDINEKRCEYNALLGSWERRRQHGSPCVAPLRSALCDWRKWRWICDGCKI